MYKNLNFVAKNSQGKSINFWDWNPLSKLFPLWLCDTSQPSHIDVCMFVLRTFPRWRCSLCFSGKAIFTKFMLWLWLSLWRQAAPSKAICKFKLVLLNTTHFHPGTHTHTHTHMHKFSLKKIRRKASGENVCRTQENYQEQVEFFFFRFFFGKCFPENGQVKTPRKAHEIVSKLSIYLSQGDRDETFAECSKKYVATKQKTYDEHKFEKFIVPVSYRYMLFPGLPAKVNAKEFAN